MADHRLRSIQGILGEKLGMTQVFDADNRMVPVTVVKAGPCVVTQVRTPDKDGYSAVQIAFGAVDPRKVTKPETGHFRKAGVPPRRSQRSPPGRPGTSRRPACGPRPGSAAAAPLPCGSGRSRAW